MVFGGVADDELADHRMKSVFYDEIFGCDVDRRNWFKVNVKAAAATAEKVDVVEGEVEGGEGEGEEEEGKNGQGRLEASGGGDAYGGPSIAFATCFRLSHNPKSIASVVAVSESVGYDANALRKDMGSYIDGAGNVVFETIVEEGTKALLPMPPNPDNGDSSSSDDEEEEEKEEERKPSAAPAAPPPLPPSGVTPKQVTEVDKNGLPAPVKRTFPLPRINGATCVKGNVMYVYGGLLEIGDREVTLDDFWCVSPISKVALHQYKPLTIEYFLLDYLMVKQNALLRY